MDAAAATEWDTFWSTRPTDIKVTLGAELVDAAQDFVAVAMTFRPEIAQATGVFSAGALIQLADIAATWLCLRTSGALVDTNAPFPFAVQMNAHLLGNVGEGRVSARASLASSGKTMMVAETLVVADATSKRLLLLTSTHLLRQPSPAVR